MNDVVEDVVKAGVPLDTIPDEVTKVVFLDIDGPMIPDTMLLAEYWASYERKMPPTTVAVVNYLCRESGARIVTNTMHNDPLLSGHGQWAHVPQIHDALIREGVKAEYLHKDPKTAYPEVPSRFQAIQYWLIGHPEVTEWISFDDDNAWFEATDPHLVWVDSGCGLSMGHLTRALKYFGIERMPFARW